MAVSADTIRGSCQCGAVQYEISGKPMLAAICHCNDCRKSSGADHSTIALFPESSVKISGSLQSFSCVADSGAQVQRSFCPTCGSTVCGRMSNVPDAMVIMAGTIDEGADLRPSFAVYAKRRNAWDHIDPTLPVFDMLPPRGD